MTPPARQPPSARALQDRLQGVRNKADAKHGRQRLALDGVDAADLGDPEDLREHHDADTSAHRPPPPKPIPAHLRAYLVGEPAAGSRWRHDYGHDPEAVADDGKSPRYPGGRCTRLYCWPCRIAELDAGEPRTWDGAARMARARQAAGAALDDLDREALKRADDAPTGRA